MTHTYAAKRLLEHGPLTWREMADITRWQRGALDAALRCLMETGLVIAERSGPHRNRYRLAA